MKILRNETYRELVEYKTLYRQTTNDLFKMSDTNNVLSEKILKARKALREANKTIKKMEKDICSLEKERKELEKKLEESMSGKYLKKTLPPEKPYSTFGIKVKSNAVRSKIAKSIRESD